MIRILWKEFREKVWWTAALTGCAVLVVLFKGAYTFIGSFNPFDDLGWTPSVIAFMMGGCAFAHELDRGGADFLFSRPVSWKKALLAKLFVGAASVLITIIVTEAVYVLSAPPQYSAFMTLPRLLHGAEITVRVIGIPYLFGVGCSLVLPGLAGASLTFMIWWILMAVIGAQYDALTGGKMLAGGMWYFLSIPLAIAGHLTVRFGLTLTTMQRARRYALMSAIGIVVAVAVGAALPGHRRTNANREWSFSPDGKYVVYADRIVRNQKDHLVGIKMVRLSDGKTSTLSSFKFAEPIHWNPNGIAFSHTNGTLSSVRMDVQGRTHTKSLNTGAIPSDGTEPGLFLSPDRTMALVVASRVTASEWAKRAATGNNSSCGVDDGNCLVSIRIGGLRKTCTKITSATDYWWQSNTEIGYLDDGKRHIVRVITPEAKP